MSAKSQTSHGAKKSTTAKANVSAKRSYKAPDVKKDQKLSHVTGAPPATGQPG